MQQERGKKKKSRRVGAGVADNDGRWWGKEKYRIILCEALRHQRCGGPAEVLPKAYGTRLPPVLSPEPPEMKKQMHVLPWQQTKPCTAQLHSNNGGVNFFVLFNFISSVGWGEGKNCVAQYDVWKVSEHHSIWWPEVGVGPGSSLSLALGGSSFLGHQILI